MTEQVREYIPIVVWHKRLIELCNMQRCGDVEEIRIAQLNEAEAWHLVCDIRAAIVIRPFGVK